MYIHIERDENSSYTCSLYSYIHTNEREQTGKMNFTIRMNIYICVCVCIYLMCSMNEGIYKVNREEKTKEKKKTKKKTRKEKRKEHDVNFRAMKISM